MISRDHQSLSISKQCDILGVSRSSFYSKPKGESELNLELMELMDKHYLDHPYKGARRMHVWLTKDENYKVSSNRIERLYYKVMGLRAIMPGKHTTKRNKAHKVYPYLLRNLDIVRPNQVWAIDITYIPMKKGFMYLTAIIDLYSRYVVGWSVSNTMDAEWCRQAVQDAISKYGKPEIINTDQGSQFTSREFTDYIIKDCKIDLSMDGKGRATDNAFIERLWRTVKYEKVYLSPPKDGTDLTNQLQEFFIHYNYSRRHSSIQDDHPVDWYHSKVKQAA